MTHPDLAFALAQFEMNDGPEIQDACLMAGELLAQRFKRSLYSELVPEVRDMIPDDAELEALQSALLRFIDQH